MAEPFGRYQLLKRIAGGGMGEVFLARQGGIQGFEKLLVIKTLLPHLTENDEFVEMFLDEARLAAKLSHPNLCSIFDLGEVEGVFYIAMDYVHGEDLKRMWKQAYKVGTTIPVPIACRVIADAAAGLSYAHRLTDDDGNPLNLVHRDVSPQNILLTFDGGVKLIDFGVAKAAGRATQTQTGALKGKYAYMSPEQVDGKELDQRSDIFALGILLWEMVTGSRLFRADTDVGTLKLVARCEVPLPSARNPEAPPELDPIILRALARNRDERYATMEELRLDLENWLAASRAPGSSAHLAAFMRSLFSDRLKREGNRGPLSDVDPNASGFSPLGRSAVRPVTRDTSDTSNRSLVRREAKGSRVAAAEPEPQKKLGVPVLVGIGAAVALLAGGALVMMRPKPEPVVAIPVRVPAAATGSLTITTHPAGAEVRVDGQVRGTTPVHDLELQAGQEVRLELIKSGYRPLVREHLMVAQGPIPLEFTLEAEAPDAARVELHSQPEGAQVLVGGQPIGQTPTVWSSAVRDTPVTLTFRLRGYQTAELAVTPGRDRSATAPLVRAHVASKSSPQAEAAPAIKMNR